MSLVPCTGGGGGLLTTVVMPCLDEADCVSAAIASLGFRPGYCSPGVRLVVVDNGSTDGTIEILDALRGAMPDAVHVVREAKRGYVPPRRRGVIEAERIAVSLGFRVDEVLILQADADTVYREDYVGIMREAAVDSRGVIFEGSTKPPLSFVERYPAYIAAQRLVDDVIEPMDALDEDEVVLDDKVCGFRLSDYLAWGGHFEESTVDGDAIHAETTRLFVRARLVHGVRKVRIDPAGAIPSRRKILVDPWLQYATVGFPREASWVAARRCEAATERDLERFARRVCEGAEPEAVRLRIAHQLVLFRYLPALISVVEGTRRLADLPLDVRQVLTTSTVPDSPSVAISPGAVLSTLLNLIDSEPRLFPQTPALARSVSS